MDIGGGIPLGLPVASQDFNVYDGTTQVGTITTGEDVTNLLGLTNTEFTVLSATPGTGDSAAELPTVGSVYDAFNLANGWENVYTAIPGTAGAPDTVTDTLVTPFGNINLDSLFGGFDALAGLNPGDAFGAGLDAASAAATTVDPLAFLGL